MLYNEKGITFILRIITTYSKDIRIFIIAIDKLLDTYALQLSDPVFYTTQIIINVVLIVLIPLLWNRMRKYNASHYAIALRVMRYVCYAGCAINIIAIILCILK